MRVHVCVKKMETETDRQLRDSGQEHGLSCVLFTLLRALTTDLCSHMYQTTNIPSRPGAVQETQEDANKCDLVLFLADTTGPYQPFSMASLRLAHQGSL